ncbi:hypothetical protein EJB05_50312, partial [Eragrostis curvula]
LGEAAGRQGRAAATVAWRAYALLGEGERHIWHAEGNVKEDGSGVESCSRRRRPTRCARLYTDNTTANVPAPQRRWLPAARQRQRSPPTSSTTRRDDDPESELDTDVLIISDLELDAAVDLELVPFLRLLDLDPSSSLCHKSGDFHPCLDQFLLSFVKWLLIQDTFKQACADDPVMMVLPAQMFHSGYLQTSRNGIQVALPRVRADVWI